MKRKNQSDVFSLEFLILNWIDKITKAKLRLKSIRQVKLVHQKITKKGFESFISAFLTKSNGSFLKAQHL